MPVYDWTLVDAGVFHDFHTVWMGALRTALNSGLLPSDYYALAEQLAGSIGPDVIALHAPTGESNSGSRDLGGATALAAAPPKVKLTCRSELEAYTKKQRSVVIRHVSDHRIIALIEVLSPGNKHSRHAFRTFVNKAASALSQGIHLLLIDLLPPSTRDPQGIHGVVWEEITGDSYVRPVDKPLTLVSYAAGLGTTAFVEPIAVGDVLPDMPLFLDPEAYVNVPLEPTYRAAYEGFPRYYRNILES